MFLFFVCFLLYWLCFFLFVFYFIRAQLIYNVVLLMISSMTPLYMYKYIFIFFSIIVCHRILNTVTCVTLLSIHPAHNSLPLLWEFGIADLTAFEDKEIVMSQGMQDSLRS